MCPLAVPSGAAIVVARPTSDTSARAQAGHLQRDGGGTAQKEGIFQDGEEPVVWQSTIGMAAPGQGVVHGGIRMRLKGGADDAKTTGKRQRDPKAK